MSEMLLYARYNQAVNNGPGKIRNGLLAGGLCLLLLSCATTKPAAFLDKGMPGQDNARMAFTAEEAFAADPGAYGRIDTVSLTSNDPALALMADAGSDSQPGQGFTSQGDDDFRYLNMYVDASFLGATYFSTGIGLSLYNDIVKFQFNVALAPPGDRYTGWVFGGKIITNVLSTKLSRFFGPDWEFYTTSLAVGANFSWFSMDDSSLGGTRHRDPLFMGAVLGQWEIIKADMSYFFPNWQYFKSLSLYAEPQIWFASSDINAETIIKLSYGVRVSMF